MKEHEELLWNVASPAHFSPLGTLLSGGGHSPSIWVRKGAKKDGNYSEETERCNHSENGYLTHCNMGNQESMHNKNIMLFSPVLGMRQAIKRTKLERLGTAVGQNKLE